MRILLQHLQSLDFLINQEMSMLTPAAVSKLRRVQNASFSGICRKLPVCGKLVVLPATNKYVYQPIKIGIMRLMLLRAATKGCASHSQTSHSYYLEKRDYANNLKFSMVREERLRSLCQINESNIIKQNLPHYFIESRKKENA